EIGETPVFVVRRGKSLGAETCPAVFAQLLQPHGLAFQAFGADRFVGFEISFQLRGRRCHCSLVSLAMMLRAKIAQELKPPNLYLPSTARLKSCPFKTALFCGLICPTRAAPAPGPLPMSCIPCLRARGPIPGRRSARFCRLPAHARNRA